MIPEEERRGWFGMAGQWWGIDPPSRQAGPPTKPDKATARYQPTATAAATPLVLLLLPNLPSCSFPSFH
nr:unnamed protein product [Digitaria exilis]